MNLSLKGRVALISGGSSGIGLAIAQAYAKAGASVAITGRRKELVEKEADALRKSGAQALAIAGDVAKPEDCARAVAETVAKFGALHILVNNAGIFRMGLLDQMSVEDIQALVAIDLAGPAYLTKYAIPHLRKHKESGGALVLNISSSLAIAPSKNVSIYGATKAGLDYLTRSWAKEWGAEQIRVNAILPGATETPIFETAMPSEFVPQAKESMAKAHALGRMGKPEEIAAMALFLASPEASWMTGSIIPVDGGISLGA